MKFLIEPSQGPWVAVSDNYAGDDSEEKVKERLNKDILSRQMWLADISTIAKVPSLEIALQAIGTSHFNPKYLKWLAVTTMALTVKDKDAEADCWHRYSHKFLKRNNGDEDLKKFLSPHKIEETIYPGVNVFFDNLSSWKYFVTRNVERVGKEYRRGLRFKFFHETNDKEDRANKLYLAHPHRKEYGVSGTSPEDIIMVDTLIRYGCDVLSLQVCDKLKQVDDQFDVAIGKNYQGLVSILESMD